MFVHAWRRPSRNLLRKDMTTLLLFWYVSWLDMPCSDNEQCSYSKVQRKITKQGRPNTGLEKEEVGSGAIEESSSSADRNQVSLQIYVLFFLDLLISWWIYNFLPSSWGLI